LDYLLLSRVAKLVGLLGFFLPWVTVSCSGTNIIEATGWQLMIGDVRPTEGFSEISQGQGGTDDADPNPFVIAAFAVAVIGLIASFATKARVAAIVMMATGLGGVGLAYYSVQNMRAEMTRSMNEQQQRAGADTTDGSSFFSQDQERDMARAMASAIQVEEQEGYWLTIIGFAIAALLGLIMLASPVGARAPPKAPDGS
jgi:hypothetical protein